MRAARIHGYREPFRIEEIPTPEPGPGEVLVRIASAGACHSDLHLMSGELPMIGQFPSTLGHENAGYVHALGPGAVGFESEEPVLVFGGWGCGSCRVCLGGEEQLCDFFSWGGIGRPGGYAEYLVVPSARHLVRLPGAIDPAVAAPLADAALTPYRAVKRALPRLVPGTTAVTIGVGGLGQYGLQLLKTLSPARVVAVDVSPAKRALATELGADLVIDSTEADAASQIAAFTADAGAAAVVDFVGSDQTLALAGRAVGRKGLLVLVGLAGGSLPFSFMGVAVEAEFVASDWGSRNELAEVVALAERGLVTGRVERYGLEEINHVFERLRAGQIEGRAVLNP